MECRAPLLRATPQRIMAEPTDHSPRDPHHLLDALSMDRWGRGAPERVRSAEKGICPASTLRTLTEALGGSSQHG